MEDERSRFIKMHRCPACGGTLVFSPEKGRLVCEYCDEEYDVPKDEPDVTQVAPTAQVNKLISLETLTSCSFIIVHRLKLERIFLSIIVLIAVRMYLPRGRLQR